MGLIGGLINLVRGIRFTTEDTSKNERVRLTLMINTEGCMYASFELSHGKHTHKHTRAFKFPPSNNRLTEMGNSASDTDICVQISMFSL